MEIRVITREHLDEYRHIVSHSFERGMGCGITAEELEGTERFGVFEGGRLQATLRLLPFQMFFASQAGPGPLQAGTPVLPGYGADAHERRLQAERRPCGGVAGVACEPAARGRGYAGALMKHALEVMRERGQYLSSLWPFSFDYYRGYGWEWVGPGYRYKVPLELIPQQEESRYVEPVLENVPATLNPVYERFAIRYNGMLVRDARRWEAFERVWGERAHTVFAYCRDGKVEGYAKVRYKEKEEEAEAQELVAVTNRAYRGLLGVLRRYAMTVKTMEWRAALDDPLWSIVCHWDIETKLRPQGMSRIVDVKPALEALKPDSALSGSAVISVQDEKAPWNAGTWRITVDSGMVEVKSDSADPGISLDIQALTQAYWGAPSLSHLRTAGRIEVKSPPEFEILKLLFPPRTPERLNA